AIDAAGADVPGVFDAGGQPLHRKIADEIAVPLAGGARAEVVRQKRRGAAEIISRRFRIGGALAAQETADVAAVFAQKRIHVVFTVTLEGDKRRAAALLFHESIDAGRG